MFVNQVSSRELFSSNPGQNFGNTKKRYDSSSVRSCNAIGGTLPSSQGNSHQEFYEFSQSQDCSQSLLPQSSEHKYTNSRDGQTINVRKASNDNETQSSSVVKISRNNSFNNDSASTTDLCNFVDRSRNRNDVEILYTIKAQIQKLIERQNDLHEQLEAFKNDKHEDNATFISKIEERFCQVVKDVASVVNNLQNNAKTSDEDRQLINQESEKMAKLLKELESADRRSNDQMKMEIKKFIEKEMSSMKKFLNSDRMPNYATRISKQISDFTAVLSEAEEKNCVSEKDLGRHLDQVKRKMNKQQWEIRKMMNFESIASKLKTDDDKRFEKLERKIETKLRRITELVDDSNKKMMDMLRGLVDSVPLKPGNEETPASSGAPSNQRLFIPFQTEPISRLQSPIATVRPCMKKGIASRDEAEKTNLQDGSQGFAYRVESIQKKRRKCANDSAEHLGDSYKDKDYATEGCSESIRPHGYEIESIFPMMSQSENETDKDDEEPNAIIGIDSDSDCFSIEIPSDEEIASFQDGDQGSITKQNEPLNLSVKIYDADVDEFLLWD